MSAAERGQPPHPKKDGAGKGVPSAQGRSGADLPRDERSRRPRRRMSTPNPAVPVSLQGRPGLSRFVPISICVGSSLAEMAQYPHNPTPPPPSPHDVGLLKRPSHRIRNCPRDSRHADPIAEAAASSDCLSACIDVRGAGYRASIADQARSAEGAGHRGQAHHHPGCSMNNRLVASAYRGRVFESPDIDENASRAAALGGRPLEIDYLGRDRTQGRCLCHDLRSRELMASAKVPRPRSRDDAAVAA